MSVLLSEKDIDFITERGYLVIEDFLSNRHLKELLDEVDRLKNFNVFHPAKIGKDLSKRVNESIRSDSLAWVTEWEKLESLKIYRSKIEKIKDELKENFFLTLRSFEAHFSFYSNGEFYLKHLDQHKESRHRQVTTVLYLSTLKEGEGGELVLYDKDDKNKTLDIVIPKCGRLVVFFSAWLYHEVKPSFKNRYSLTGWLRDDDELGIT